MNKSLRGLLIALVAVSPAVASDSNNKTHLNPARICREGVAAYTTFHTMKADRNEDRIGGNVEVTGFYGRSVNGSHLAKSFGADGTDAIAVGSGALGTLHLNKTVLNNLILHSLAGNTLAGTLHFDPKQTMYGARLDYFQRFDKWLDGLFFALTLPFVHVRNDLNAKVRGSVPGRNAAEGIKLIDIFTKSQVNREDPIFGQGTLKYARMCSDSKTGLGDIMAQVGWRFLEGRKYHAGVNAELILPTASKPNAKYLWGARTGESKWGLGAGLDGSAMLWEQEDQNIQILAALQYRYLFEGNEKRTLGLSELLYNDGSKVNLIKNPLLSQYYLVGTAGKTGLQPLANVSTFNVKVRPGSQLDGTLAFAFNSGGFTLDVGYNMFWKEAERVRCKSDGTCKQSCETEDACDTECDTKTTCIPGDWKNDTYGVTRTGREATEVFATDGSSTLAETAAGFIDASQFDYKAAETPAQLIHTAFTGVGYKKEYWGYPIMAGVGVAYHFPSSNRDALEGYSFWAKAGISF